jgi:hypothetical protein
MAASRGWVGMAGGAGVLDPERNSAASRDFSMTATPLSNSNSYPYFVHKPVWHRFAAFRNIYKCKISLDAL